MQEHHHEVIQQGEEHVLLDRVQDEHVLIAGGAGNSAIARNGAIGVKEHQHAEVQPDSGAGYEDVLVAGGAGDCAQVTNVSTSEHEHHLTGVQPDGDAGEDQQLQGQEAQAGDQQLQGQEAHAYAGQCCRPVGVRGQGAGQGIEKQVQHRGEAARQLAAVGDGFQTLFRKITRIRRNYSGVPDGRVQVRLKDLGFLGDETGSRGKKRSVECEPNLIAKKGRLS